MSSSKHNEMTNKGDETRMTDDKDQNVHDFVDMESLWPANPIVADPESESNAVHSDSQDSLSNINLEDLFHPSSSEEISIDEIMKTENDFKSDDCPTSLEQPLRSSVDTLVNQCPFEGKYKFEMSFAEAPLKVLKSPASIYSSPLKKLYADMRKNCPIRFRTSEPPPSGSYICCIPLFLKPDQRNEVIEQCQNHASQEKSSVERGHFVRCMCPRVEYLKDELSGRLYAVFPYVGDQPSEWKTCIFQFSCLSSCLSRRPIELLFTLECSNKVLGCCSVEVRVCRCPGRDMNHDELELHSKSSLTKHKIAPPKIEPSLAPPHKRVKTHVSENDRRVYTLHIKGYKNYKLLHDLNKRLEIADLATDELIGKHRGSSKEDDEATAS